MVSTERLSSARPLALSGTSSAAELISQLALGAHGSAVRDLQRLLNDRGARLGVDGLFGPKTQAAVRGLQRSLGLSPTGAYGPEIASSLARQRSTDRADDFGRVARRRATTEPRGRPAPPTLDAGRADSLRQEALRRMAAQPDTGTVAALRRTVAPTPPTPDGLSVGDQSRAVRAAEQKLKRAGFNPGAVDGRFDAATARAVRQFQEAVGRNATGVLDDRTAGTLGRVDERIRKNKGKLIGPGQRNARTLAAEKRLARLGYDPGPIDGVYDLQTGKAMQKFRVDQKGKGGSLLMGKTTEHDLERESNALGHDPIRRRVKPSASRRRSDARTARAAAFEHRDGSIGLGEGSRGSSVKYMQEHLRAAGFDPKHTNGRFDERTRGALEAFQRRSELPVTGRLDPRTWRKLQGTTMESKNGYDPTQRKGERSGAVKLTEQRLRTLGYDTGKVDGRYTDATQKAVNAFRRKQHLGGIGSGVGKRVHDALIKAVRRKRNSIPTRRDTGYINGQPFAVKLGKVDGFWTGLPTARAYQRMERAARKDGVDLNIVSGFRTMAKQRELYALYGPSRAAQPGYSNHQNGRALDLNVATVPGNMAAGTGAVYSWLARNAGRFGFQRIPSEAWHWEYRR